MRFLTSVHEYLKANSPVSSVVARMAGAILILIVLSPAISHGYTVLTHEAIIDSVWDTSLKKLLLKRFPSATQEELVQAHAYAYGGCIIQDMGYYPFSSRFFSDLTHYVRSGDFIVALIRESQDLSEYAFALGAMEHYVADTEGHRMATNRAVSLLYPKLRRKYGRDVTYWDNPAAHLRTEWHEVGHQLEGHRTRGTRHRREARATRWRPRDGADADRRATRYRLAVRAESGRRLVRNLAATRAERRGEIRTESVRMVAAARRRKPVERDR